MICKICPDCGAHLDFGERCDCQQDKKTAPDAESTEGGSLKGSAYEQPLLYGVGKGMSSS